MPTLPDPLEAAGEGDGGEGERAERLSDAAHELERLILQAAPRDVRDAAVLARLVWHLSSPADGPDEDLPLARLVHGLEDLAGLPRWHGARS